MRHPTAPNSIHQLCCRTGGVVEPQPADHVPGAGQQPCRRRRRGAYSVRAAAARAQLQHRGGGNPVAQYMPSKRVIDALSYIRDAVSAFQLYQACAEGGQPSFSTSWLTRRSSALMAVLSAAEVSSGDAQRHAHERPLPGLRRRLLQLRRQFMPGLPSRWVHIGFTFFASCFDRLLLVLSSLAWTRACMMSSRIRGNAMMDVICCHVFCTRTVHRRAEPEGGAVLQASGVSGPLRLMCCIFTSQARSARAGGT